MARKLREEVAGGVFHVYARGNDKAAVFLGEEDRHRYLTILARTVRRQRWNLLAFCLMENHIHLLVETPEPNLGHGMQRLHGDYAQIFNKRHGRVGHVFQGRFGATRIVDDAQLWTAARYVAQNPVEAGLCSSPERYPWSSHRHVVAASSPWWLAEDRLLALFSGHGGDPRTRYLAATRI